ncbi:MAG: DUF3833 domain-containing protein [Candidatus Thiodiazotropha sp. 6PLUC2]
MKPIDYLETQPEFDLFEYFDGEQQAWGVFVDRFGTLRKRFTVKIVGNVTDNLLKLEESFVYDDGSTQQRVWLINRVDKHNYTGTALDIVGEAKGQAYGSSLQWQYKMDLSINNKDWRVHFNDWMFLIDEETLVNRAEVTKFGIKIGEVLLFFRKSVNHD